MVWLAEVADKHRNLSVVPRSTVKTLIAVTHDKDTVKFLTKITPIQGRCHTADGDYVGKPENQIDHTKLPILPAINVHREPSFSAEGGEELPLRHTGDQKSSDSAVAGRTTLKTTAARYTNLQGREVYRKTNFLWEMPGMGASGVGMRQKCEVRLLFSEPRHKNLQGKTNKGIQLYRNVPIAPRSTTRGVPSVP